MTELPLWATMGRARANDHATSRAAGEALASLTPAHAQLLAAYMAAPLGLTDEEAAVAAGVDPRSCWWKRCGELRKAGLVAPTGATRPGSSGRQRIVCAATGGQPLPSLPMV